MLIYLVVAALSGGIAYLGNQLGRHVGRRKMSVFGMRPRHTSIFVTTVTGMMIALGTLTLAAIFAEPVRLMLVGTEELEHRQQELTQQISQLTDVVARGNMLYGVDQQIFLTTIPPGIPADRLEENLVQAIALANRYIIEKYNKLAASKNVAPVSSDSILLSYKPEELSNMVARAREQEGVMGLKVVADRNYLFGDKEPLPVRFTVFPVKLTFKAGQVVASKTVDPHSPTFLMEWYQFIEEIKMAALARGMREVGTYGFELSSDAMNALIQKIEAERGPATLVAVAKKDLYESSSLDLDIEVRSGTSSDERSGHRTVGQEPVARTR